MEIIEKVNTGSLLKFILVLVASVSAFVWVQSDVQKLKQQQQRLDSRQTELQNEMRTSYITREQLDYIVVQRLERLEVRMDDRFDELKLALEKELNED